MQDMDKQCNGTPATASNVKDPRLLQSETFVTELLEVPSVQGKKKPKAREALSVWRVTAKEVRLELC